MHRARQSHCKIWYDSSSMNTATDKRDFGKCKLKTIFSRIILLLQVPGGFFDSGMSPLSQLQTWWPVMCAKIPLKTTTLNNPSGRMCVCEQAHHWSRYWRFTCSVPFHYLNQCWLIGNWTLRKNFNFYPTRKRTRKCRLWPFCLGLSVLVFRLAAWSAFSHVRPIFWSAC